MNLLALRFWYTLFALAVGVSVVTLILLLASQRQRLLALTYAGFLASLWFILLSFAIGAFVDLVSGEVTPPDAVPAATIIAFVINGVGSIGYIAVAPFFYHAILGVRVTRTLQFLYRLVDAFAVAIVSLLFIASVRRLAMNVLNLLLFAVVLAGIIMIALGYRRVSERSLRRAIRVFVVLAAVFFPLMFLESRPVVGDTALGAFSNFALPSFFTLLSLLSIPFALRRLNRPAYWQDGAPTDHFMREFALSARETEVLAKLGMGMTNREIAEALFISPKTVENHLSSVFSKTDVSSRVQLLTLMLSNQ